MGFHDVLYPPYSHQEALLRIQFLYGAFETAIESLQSLGLGLVYFVPGIAREVFYAGIHLIDEEAFHYIHKDHYDNPWLKHSFSLLGEGVGGACMSVVKLTAPFFPRAVRKLCELAQEVRSEAIVHQCYRREHTPPISVWHHLGDLAGKGTAFCYKVRKALTP